MTQARLPVSVDRLRVLKQRVARQRQHRRLLGRGADLAPDCRIEGRVDFGSEPYLVSIGPHVTISGRVAFITHDGATWVFRHQPGFEHVVKFGRIVVLENCFIGYGSIILPGVTIGPDSVVAAGSVVTRDVSPGVVAGGVPAKHITTTEDFALRTRKACPDYDVAAYAQDKRRELERLMPRPARGGVST